MNRSIDIATIKYTPAVPMKYMMKPDKMHPLWPNIQLLCVNIWLKIMILQ